jgi:hypothetical protein
LSTLPANPPFFKLERERERERERWEGGVLPACKSRHMCASINFLDEKLKSNHLLRREK